MVPHDAPVSPTQDRRLGGRLLGDPRGAHRTDAIGRQSKRMKAPEVLLSWGELIDKITILEIKSGRLKNPAALANVNKELKLLAVQADIAMHSVAEIPILKERLSQVNQALWDIEDEIRAKEARQEFDAEFIKLARSVYQRNDERAAIKRQINTALSSDLVEEKSHPPY